MNVTEASWLLETQFPSKINEISGVDHIVALLLRRQVPNRVDQHYSGTREAQNQPELAARHL